MKILIMDFFKNNDRIQKMVEGVSSNSKINNTRDEMIPEEEMSSEGAVRRINSVWARASSTMIPDSVKGIHLSNEKLFLEDPNMSIQSVKSISYEEWCKKKEIMQRLKDKLVEDAKLNVYEQMQMKDGLNETRKSWNWKWFKNWWKSKDKELKLK